MKKDIKKWVDAAVAFDEEITPTVNVLFVPIFAILFLIALGFSFAASATTYDDAKQMVSNEIERTSGVENVGINFSKGEAYLRNINSNNLEVSSMNVDTDRKTFTGYVSANKGVPYFISGRYFQSIKVPVVNRNISRSETISAADITYVAIDAGKVNDRNIITDASQLIGKSPSRGIYKNNPLTAQQITSATTVIKNQDVVMIFSAGGVTIKDSGVALDEGANGDVIRVKNKNSNRIVSATIVDGRTVAVSNNHQALAKL